MFVIPADLEHEIARLREYAVTALDGRRVRKLWWANWGTAFRGKQRDLSEKGEVLAQLQATGAGIAIAIEGETGWRTKEVMLGGR
jgi:hypothetical protein